MVHRPRLASSQHVWEAQKDRHEASSGLLCLSSSGKCEQKAHHSVWTLDFRTCVVLLGLLVELDAIISAAVVVPQ